jgi:hypothetical protein
MLPGEVNARAEEGEGAGRMRPRIRTRDLARVALAALAALMLAAAVQAAAAEDTVKVALGQRGDWATAASELGQNAGVFGKRGLALHLLYTMAMPKRCRRSSPAASTSASGSPLRRSWLPM